MDAQQSAVRCPDGSPGTQCLCYTRVRNLHREGFGACRHLIPDRGQSYKQFRNWPNPPAEKKGNSEDERRQGARHLRQDARIRRRTGATDEAAANQCPIPQDGPGYGRTGPDCGGVHRGDRRECVRRESLQKGHHTFA